MLVAVSKGILKESYTNPYEVQPAIRIRKESYTIRTDSRLPTGLASLAASLAGVGGGFVFIFNFLIFLIFLIGFAPPPPSNLTNLTPVGF